MWLKTTPNAFELVSAGLEAAAVPDALMYYPAIYVLPCSVDCFRSRCRCRTVEMGFERRAISVRRVRLRCGYLVGQVFPSMEAHPT